MPYIEAQPSGPTRRFVQAFWQSSGPFDETTTERVLPDACADFIFDLSDPTRRTEDAASFVGTMSQAIVVPRPANCDLFGVRFKPGAAWLIWRMPMRALSDTSVALDDVAARASLFAERLAPAADFASRIALIEAWLEKRIAEADIDGEKQRTVSAINAHLEAGAGGTALASLGWNERKLQRFFESAYGLSPATMRCFWRFEHLRRALVAKPEVNLATIALDHGYSDQAHMAREFQRFAGVSITAWRTESGSAGVSPALAASLLTPRSTG